MYVRTSQLKYGLYNFAIHTYMYTYVHTLYILTCMYMYVQYVGHMYGMFWPVIHIFDTR